MFGLFHLLKARRHSLQQSQLTQWRRLVVMGLSLTALTMVSFLNWSTKSALSPLPSVSAQQPPSAQANDLIVPNRYIVVFKEDAFANGVTATGMTASQLTEQIVTAANGDLHFTYQHALKGFAATLSLEAVQALTTNSAVAAVEPDQLVQVNEVQSPVRSWGLDRIDQRLGPLSDSYRFDVAGQGVNIYVVDSGLRGSHEEFRGRIGNGVSFVADEGNPNSDCQGHGTHVAATAAGTTYGVAKRSILHSVRVFDCNGRGTFSAVMAGVDWVTANHMKPAVVNMSLSGGKNEGLDQAVTNLITAGVPVVVAAGNIEPRSPDPLACNHSPARVSAAITVGSSSLWGVDRRSPFSKYGSCVDIFAPGHNITSAGHNSDWDEAVKFGTSMAAPHVTGWVAMYLSVFPRATPAEVNSELIRHSTKDVLWETGDPSTPNRLLYVTNIADAGCLVQTSVASAAEAAGLAPETASAFALLYRLRDEVFPDSELGWELIRIHRTHSFEAARLLLTNQQLRTELLEMLESTRPAVDSLLNGDGQRPLDSKLIQQIESYLNDVAWRASPEMRADLLRVLQKANLWSYQGRPVRDVWNEIGRPQMRDRSRNEARPQ
jgi:subtilisin family serine protease